MAEWDVERGWRVRTTDGRESQVATRDLASSRVACLLGPAGSGKTFEMRRLAAVEGVAERDVIRMAMWADAPHQLQLELESRTKAGATALYLDALDEASTQCVWLDEHLARWLRKLSEPRPRIRLSCRSTVWPAAIEQAAKDAFGEESVVVARIVPFSEPDVRAIAEREGLGAQAFIDQIRRSNAESLSALPLTLRMMLRQFRRDGRLPANRLELFDKAVRDLAAEHEDRDDRRTGPGLDLATIVGAAERLACYVILCGHEVVDLDWASLESSVLSRNDLAPPGEDILSGEVLGRLHRCGLFESEGPRRFRFIHRQIAEYLAGRTLARLLLHQSKALLASPNGREEGVAGPLRETAAFAAMENTALARWVAGRDPEVIRLSDVADAEVRRMATHGYLDLFRRGVLTDFQLTWDDTPWFSLRYDGLEDDIRPVLRERGSGRDDVLAFAVSLVRGLELADLHEELAELALDPSAPMQVRTSAGRTLSKSAQQAVRRRLKPLIEDSSDDPNQELKGVALECCWPDGLSTRELLSALTPRINRSFCGSYASFLYSLPHAGFEAAEDRAAGLRWAASHIDPDSPDHVSTELIRRMAEGALNQLDDPEVGFALADLLLNAAGKPMDSPLVGVASTIAGDAATRRRLLDYLVQRSSGEDQVRWGGLVSGSLITNADFIWLLERACDSNRPENHRANYAECARYCVDWSPGAVEIWFRLREMEPVKSKLEYDLLTELDSDKARQLREWHQLSTSRRKAGGIADDSSIQEGIRALLDSAEQDRPQWFLSLATQMWQAGPSLNSPRLLSQTRGWTTADPETRRRIIRAAERFLSVSTDVPESLRAVRQEAHHGFLGAVWLLIEEDDSWADRMSAEWWERWCRPLLKSCHVNFVGESKEQREALFAILHRRAPQAVRFAAVEFLQLAHEDSHLTPARVLEVFVDIPDPEFNAMLVARLAEGQFGGDQVGEIVLFLLWRDPASVLPYCDRCLTSEPGAIQDDLVVVIASALLRSGGSAPLSLALPFLDRRPDLAKSVLRQFGGDSLGGTAARPGFFDGVSASQVGKLVELMMREYPPENDPVYEGVYSPTLDDYAIRVRDGLISRLSAQASREAVDALIALEGRFGSRYPWLRHPRSQAQRAYRQSHWAPTHPRVVARMFDGQKRRLIRDEQDAAEGIVEAIEEYGRRLHRAGSSDLEDLWNTPRKAPPEPKSEERISEKLCEAVRRYFRRYAVVADREVEIFRRKLPAEVSEEPSSEVDVLVTIPAVGSDHGEPIVIPLEVKKSGNREAKTGLKAQLVDRYMRQLRASHGVFVVMWFSAPNLKMGHRPKWRSIKEAEAELRRQANEVSGTATVTALVIDASLR